MAINKSQGQTLKEVGIDLSTPCFCHGMLYVVQSRTGLHNSVVVHAPGRVTRNVVYSEVLLYVLHLPCVLTALFPSHSSPCPVNLVALM